MIFSQKIFFKKVKNALKQVYALLGENIVVLTQVIVTLIMITIFQPK